MTETYVTMCFCGCINQNDQTQLEHQLIMYHNTIYYKCLGHNTDKSAQDIDCFKFTIKLHLNTDTTGFNDS